MALISNKLWGVEDKVQIAIDRLREFEPAEGYYLAFSGGKDSQTVYELAKMSGVKFDAHYNLTTVDPPELVRFIKDYYPEVKIHRPEKSMWQLIVENGMPPLRQIRYCCRTLKEGGGAGRVVVTGVRHEESRKRSGRKMVESCFMDGSRRFLHPVIDWTAKEVWEYLRRLKIPYCSLYDEGWTRLGCVLWPNANQEAQAERWPKIADAYKRACIRAYDAGMAKGKVYQENWKSGEDMYYWWMSGKGNKGDPDQTILFE